MKLVDLSSATIDTIVRMLCAGSMGLNEGANFALAQIPTIRSLPQQAKEEIKKDLISAILLIANREGNLAGMNLEQRREVYRALADFVAFEKSRQQVLRAMWDQYIQRGMAI